MNAYEQGLFSTHFYTLQDFMNATALYERATWLPSQSRADMPDLIYNAASHGLHHIIDHFTSQLAALGYGNSLEDARQLVVARTTACAASIQLHRHFTDNDPTSHQHCIVAANAAVAILDTVDALRLGFLDPIMAILWSTVGKVFLDEIAKLKQSADPHGRNELEMLTHSLDRIVVAMAAHTAASPLMEPYPIPSS
ncbi:hypothetical protein A0H81_02005 [Grifola frondosa]|uniref:Uncharacterized protein n=1 Tax=Grifola frondosa TaxID=5627 RepID=A0A1C7MNI8_GRIFR|nr:hypothetical protein A0H81_02005 [Grifola frondosa]